VLHRQETLEPQGIRGVLAASEPFYTQVAEVAEVLLRQLRRLVVGLEVYFSTRPQQVEHRQEPRLTFRLETLVLHRHSLDPQQVLMPGLEGLVAPLPGLGEMLVVRRFFLLVEEAPVVEWRPRQLP